MRNSIPVPTTLRCFAPRRKDSPPPRLAIAGLVLLTLLGVSAQAGTIVKADNSDALWQGSSWVGLTLPGQYDIAQWDHTVSAANTTNNTGDVGYDQTWQGIAIVDPAGAVTITGEGKLTLGNPDDNVSEYYVVDMTNATVDWVLNCPVALSAPGPRQEWYVGSGRTLSVGGLVSGGNQSFGLHKQGAGTLMMTNDSNTYPGVTDIRDGVLVCTSIKNSSTACSLGAPANANYGAIGIGATDVNGASHVGTLRYVGPGDTTGRIFRMYGANCGGVIDASGSGPLVITNSGAAVINAGTPTTQKILTLKGDNTGTNTIGGTIGDKSPTLQTALAKEGVGKWVLTAANPYTGGTTVSGGTLEIGAAGSIQGNVSVANGAVLQLDNPTALAAAAILTLDASPSPATVNLNYGPTQTINALYFGGTQKAAGTWGSTASSATHTHAAFTGAGILNVASGPVLPIYSQTNAILSVANVGSGSYQLSFQGTEGAKYYVVKSASVTAAMSTWTVVGVTNTAGTGGLWNATVSEAAPAFYRGVAVDPQP